MPGVSAVRGTLTHRYALYLLSWAALFRMPPAVPDTPAAGKQAAGYFETGPPDSFGSGGV